VVSGVRYREVSTEPLRHALSRKGAGHKDYDVTFPDGSAMQVRATPRRVFADLSEPRLWPALRILSGRVLPGMRVLVLGGGTGFAGAWVAERVAPSGVVVSLDGDAQSVAFANARYRAPNVSFELGGLEGTAGETDGAFSAVIVAEPAGEGGPEGPLKELWRLVAPGGWMALIDEDTADAVAERAGAAIEGDRELLVLADGREGLGVVLVERPAE
jgi:SAM-dependent methyltransferase